MPTAHAYLRVRPDDARDGGAGLAAIRAEVERVFATAGGPDGYARGQLYEDDADSAAVPLRQRPGGARLTAAAGRGDLLWFPRLTRSFRGLKDLAACLRVWHDRGVRVYVADLGLDTAAEGGVAGLLLVERLVELGHGWRGDLFKRQVARRLREGRHVGRPPWGTRMMGPPHARCLVVIPEALLVGREIVKRKARGEGDAEIARDLNRRKVKRFIVWTARKYGAQALRRERWTPDSVRKATERMPRLEEGILSGEYKTHYHEKGVRGGQEEGGAGQGDPAGQGPVEGQPEGRG